MFKEVNFSNILFNLIVILFTSNCLFLTALSVQFTKFMKSTNVKNIELFSSQEGLSIYQCLENCKKDATCDSLSYSDDGMKCYLSVGRQCGSSGQGLEAVDGWNVFGKHLPPVAALRSVYIYAQVHLPFNRTDIRREH